MSKGKEDYVELFFDAWMNTKYTVPYMQSDLLPLVDFQQQCYHFYHF